MELNGPYLLLPAQVLSEIQSTQALGFDRVNQEVLNRIGSIESKVKAKREAYTIELNELLKKSQLLYAFDSNPNNNGKAVVDYSSNNSMVDDIPA